MPTAAAAADAVASSVDRAMNGDGCKWWAMRHTPRAGGGAEGRVRRLLDDPGCGWDGRVAERSTARRTERGYSCLFGGRVAVVQFDPANSYLFKDYINVAVVVWSVELSPTSN